MLEINIFDKKNNANFGINNIDINKNLINRWIINYLIYNIVCVK